MSSIGGYFGLELTRGKEYHTDALKLNTGRNALEYILLAKKYRKIYVPYYTCDVLLQPIKKLKLEVGFYFIDENFEPVFDFEKIKSDQAFLYTNYFGLKDKYISTLKNKCKNLIIDNAQAFYSKPINKLDTFYSARKFFGVPDGAYLYCDKKNKQKLKKDISHQRFQHLLIRLDENAENGYLSFTKNDTSLDNNPIMKMSNLTEKILQSISYKEIAIQRKENFIYLHKALKSINKIKFKLTKDAVPMVYPFYADDLELRNKLVGNKIYTAQYWTNVLEKVKKDTVEYKYVSHLVHLPIDQRLSKQQLDHIIKTIKHEYKR